MYGDAGADRFAVDSPLFSKPGPNHDVIMDFSHHDKDKIELLGFSKDVLLAPGETFAHYLSTHPGETQTMLRVTAGNIVETARAGEATPNLEVEVHGSHVREGDFVDFLFSP
jgi:hypothetical protein